MNKSVAYYRVSTEGQADSGLGLEAQQACIESLAERKGGEIISTHTDILSGQAANRPELQAALTACELTGATLLVSRLDRLSRDVEFVARLQKSDIKFICCDYENADKTTLQVMAVMAERERELISRRTKEGLAAAKARGVKLGNPNLDSVRCTDTTAATAARVSTAAARNALLLSTIQGFEEKAGKALSLAKIAGMLNDGGYETARGKAFTAMQVSRIKTA